MYGVDETIQAFLDGGADVMAAEADGRTPLHRVARYFECPPGNIYLLLDAGATVMAKDEEAMTPWDYAQENKMFKGTEGFWALNNAQHK